MRPDDSFCLVGISCFKLEDQLPVIVRIRLIMCFDESIYRMEDIEVHGSMVLFDQRTDSGNLDKRVVEVQIFPPAPQNMRGSPNWLRHRVATPKLPVRVRLRALGA